MSSKQSWWAQCKEEYRRGYDGLPSATADRAAAPCQSQSPPRPFRIFRALILWYLSVIVLWPAAAIIAGVGGDAMVTNWIGIGVGVVPLIGALFIIFRRRYWKWFFGSWLTSALSCILLGPFGIIPGAAVSMPLVPFLVLGLCVVAHFSPPTTSSTPSEGYHDSATYDSGDQEKFWKLGGLAKRYLDNKDRQRTADIIARLDRQADAELTAQVAVGLLRAAADMVLRRQPAQRTDVYVSGANEVQMPIHDPPRSSSYERRFGSVHSSDFVRETSLPPRDPGRYTQPTYASPSALRAEMSIAQPRSFTATPNSWGGATLSQPGRLASELHPNSSGGWSLFQYGELGTDIMPNASRGYTVSKPGSLATQVSPNAWGGFTVSKPGEMPTQVFPNAAGGATVSRPDGSSYTISPTPSGASASR